MNLSEKNPYRDFPPVLGTLALSEKNPYREYFPVLGIFWRNGAKKNVVLLCDYLYTKE